MSDWSKKHTKSILIDSTIIVESSDIDGCILPVEMRLKAIELDYGPVIDFKVVTDVSYVNMDMHPFMYSKEYMNGEYSTGSIIDDTPAVRSLIYELSAKHSPLYTTTHCTHVARLIRAINGFWS